jgi:hypothetical protein
MIEKLKCVLWKFNQAFLFAKNFPKLPTTSKNLTIEETCETKKAEELIHLESDELQGHVTLETDYLVTLMVPAQQFSTIHRM